MRARGSWLSDHMHTQTEEKGQNSHHTWTEPSLCSTTFLSSQKGSTRIPLSSYQNIKIRAIGLQRAEPSFHHTFLFSAFLHLTLQWPHTPLPSTQFIYSTKLHDHEKNTWNTTSSWYIHVPLNKRFSSPKSQEKKNVSRADNFGFSILWFDDLKL